MRATNLGVAAMLLLAFSMYCTAVFWAEHTHTTFGPAAESLAWQEIILFGVPSAAEQHDRALWSKTLRLGLDDALSVYTGSSIDGHMYEESAELYQRLAFSPHIKTICETGFNGAHSALNWLAANPQAHLYSFDLGADDHRYYKIGRAIVNAAFPGRLTLTLGNSLETLRKFHSDHPDIKCDLISIDGGHHGDIAFKDIANFFPMAHRNTIVVMDDCAADHDQERVGRVAREAVEEGIFINMEKFKHFPDVGPRGSCVAQYNMEATIPDNWWQRQWP